MSDPLDQAARLAEREREAGIERARGRVVPFTGVTRERPCEDCEQFIPPARMAAVPCARRCVACEALREKGKRR